MISLTYIKSKLKKSIYAVKTGVLLRDDPNATLFLRGRRFPQLVYPMKIAAVITAVIASATTDTQTDSGDPLISFTFIPKMPVTKESGMYRNASVVNLCPRMPCSIANSASITLVELIRRLKESIKNFSSNSDCLRISENSWLGEPT
jgi:hypothetical protein